MVVVLGLLFVVINVLLCCLYGFFDGMWVVVMLVGSGVFVSLLGVVLLVVGVVVWLLFLLVVVVLVVVLWVVLFLVLNLSL